jgi:hypothetical protein
MQEYDKSSKWLIQHHGDSILRLAGIRDIDSWRPLQAELVQPRQLPDGLIEARLSGHDRPSLCVLEVATYPDARVIKQVTRDVALVFLDRDVLPEVLVLFLHPKGNVEAADSMTLNSPLGWTKWQASWKTVELWNLPAEVLLASGDVGLIPWVPLTQFDGPPEPIFRQCRARIDEDAPANEKENLLAVTQVLAGLRYNDPNLFQMFGGRQAMIESPVLQELKAEWTREGAIEATRKDIARFLAARFRVDAKSLEAELRSVDVDHLGNLVELAATCPNLESFRMQLSP